MSATCTSAPWPSVNDDLRRPMSLLNVARRLRHIKQES
jgi:hypothetical protein